MDKLRNENACTHQDFGSVRTARVPLQAGGHGSAQSRDVRSSAKLQANGASRTKSVDTFNFFCQTVKKQFAYGMFSDMLSML